MKNFLKTLATHSSDACLLAGIVLVTLGFALIYLPAGFLFCGSALMGLAYLQALRK